MSLPQLLMPITRRLAGQNLLKVQTCLKHSEVSNCIPKPEKFRLFKTSRCGSIQETLAKCSKACTNEECNVPGPRDQKCPKSAQHPALSYRDTMAKMTEKALLMRSQLSESSRKLVRTMSQVNKSHYQAEKANLTQKLDDVTRKVDAILRVNLACGNQKRNDLLVLCNRINTDMKAVKCMNECGVSTISERLEVLKGKVRERTETAVEIVRTCKGCVTPYAMQIDIVMTEKEADCLFKITDEYVKRELDYINKISQRITDENNQYLKQLTANYIEDITKFSKHLDFITSELPKIMKKASK